MKQNYRFGVGWIASNDDPTCLDETEVSGFVSTLLLADLFGKNPEQVAKDVVALRKTTRRGVAV